MRATPWLLAAALLLPLPGPASAAPEACPPGEATRVTELPLPRPASLRAEANLRQGPSIERPILARTEREEAVTVIGECGLWRLVRTGAGQEAWTHGSLLRARQPG